MYLYDGSSRSATSYLSYQMYIGTPKVTKDHIVRCITNAVKFGYLPSFHGSTKRGPLNSPGVWNILVFRTQTIIVQLDLTRQF